MLLHYIDSEKKHSVRHICCGADPKRQVAGRYAKAERKSLLSANDFRGATQRSYTGLWHRSPPDREPLRGGARDFARSARRVFPYKPSLFLYVGNVNGLGITPGGSHAGQRGAGAGRQCAACAPPHRSRGAGPVAFVMPTNTPQARTLQRAVEVCGGVQALAKALGVSLADLSHWLEGHAVPPTKVYISALDMVAGSRGKG